MKKQFLIFIIGAMFNAMIYFIQILLKIVQFGYSDSYSFSLFLVGTTIIIGAMWCLILIKYAKVNVPPSKRKIVQALILFLTLFMASLYIYIGYNYIALYIISIIVNISLVLTQIALIARLKRQ